MLNMLKQNKTNPGPERLTDLTKEGGIVTKRAGSVAGRLCSRHVQWGERLTESLVLPPPAVRSGQAYLHSLASVSLVGK